jgi:nucleotide-binding universal stress UspA family protein
MTASGSVVPIISTIQIRRILYATDFSEGAWRAFPLVTALARHYHVQLFAVHVCPPPDIPGAPEVISALERQHESEAASEMAKLLRLTNSSQLSAKTLVKTGDPVQELDRIVHDENIDVAVLSTHGRVGLRHLVMGSVAEALFRRLSCPVLSAGPFLSRQFSEPVEIRNILFPTDLSEESRAVFPYLVSLAHEYGAVITVLHVLPPETARNPEAELLAEPLRREMMHMFSPEIGLRCKAQFVIEAGDAAERILARAGEADLIGLGIRKASEITTHFRSTVTYRVLLNAGCPVLTYRFQRPWSVIMGRQEVSFASLEPSAGQ